MKTHSAVLFAVFFALLAVISSQEQGEYYCGRRLSSMLSMLCDNGLMMTGKRSEAAFEAEGFPWISVQRARSVSRGKRQVVSECCLKPCTISELLAYCA